MDAEAQRGEWAALPYVNAAKNISVAQEDFDQPNPKKVANKTKAKPASL